MAKLGDFFSKKWVVITLSLILTLLLLVSGFIWYIYPANAVARGVFVEGTDLSGLTGLEAQNLLSEADDLGEKAITLEASGNTKEFSGNEILLMRDVKSTVDNAYSIGRSGDIIDDFMTRVTLLLKPYSMRYSYSCDEDALGRILYDFGVLVNGEQRDFTVERKDSYVIIEKGTAGQSRDVSALIKAVKDSIDSGDYKVELVLKKTEPPVPTAKGICDFVYIEPEDATYSVSDGVVSITSEKYGVRVSEEEAESKLDSLDAGGKITLRTEKIKPSVTKSDLYNKLFNHTLGSYTSTYNASNSNRSKNVSLASSKIDGLVLAPGEVFSYNKTVGPRTAERGFREATMYSNGESVLGLGGGICQVSSTLYSAVLYSDLEVCERQNHSMTVDYMPKGQDATVSYGTIDFKFKNNTPNPIIISSKASGGKLTVKIMGTRPDVERTVKIINSTVSVTEKTVETVEDETLVYGEEKTLSVGKTGYVVDTYKKVYENGVEIKSEYVSRSRYRMVPQKRAVGRAPVETQIPMESSSPVFSEETAPTEDSENDESASSVTGEESEEDAESSVAEATASGTENAPTEETEEEL